MRYPYMFQQMGMRRMPKQAPVSNPYSPEPIVNSMKVNSSEQNKQGVPYGDRKHRGVSRNVLGGFYTS